MWAFNVVIPSGKVASDLTDFPLRIDLADALPSFWAGVRSDGGDIRAHIDATELPVDVVHIDTGTETGEIYVKIPTVASASDTEITLSGDGVSAAPAVTDPNGRNAVWSDYRAVWMFRSLEDRTGNGHDMALAGSGAALSDGWLTMGGSGNGFAAIGAILTTWVMMASVVFTTIGGTNRAVISHSNQQTSDSSRASVLNRAGSGDSSQVRRMGTWNSSSGFLMKSGSEEVVDTIYRTGLIQEEATARTLVYNGDFVATGATAQRPTGATPSIYLGTDDSSGSERLIGRVNRAYLRAGVLTADWLAAEYDNWEFPSTFYTVTEAPFRSDITFVYDLEETPFIESDITFVYNMSPEFFSDITLTYDMPTAFVSDIGFVYDMPETQTIELSQLPILLVDLPKQPIQISQLPILAISLPDQATQVSQVPISLVMLVRDVPEQPPLEPGKPVPALTAIVPDVPVTETWSFLTVVDHAARRKERRARLRETPRYSLQFEALVLGDYDRRQIYNILYKYQNVEFYYPMYQYSVKLNASVDVGATRLYFDPTRTDIRAGEQLALFDPYIEQTYFAEIAAVETDGATLATPLSVAAGAAWLVCPAPAFRMPAGSGQALRMQALAGQMGVRIETTRPRTFQRVPSAGLLTTYDDLVVLDQRFIGENDEEFDRFVHWLDNGTSIPIPFYYTRTTFIKGKRTYKYDRFTGSDYWRAFIDHCKGRQRSFLLPTFRDDIPVINPVALNSNRVVTDNIQAEEYFGNNAYRYVRIERLTGVIYRKVVDRQLIYDETGTAVALEVRFNQTIGNNVGDNEITKISFVNRVRLDSDDISVIHENMDSFITLPIRTVNE